jgi:RNA polymerase sigma factor (sigma-70 family)
MNAHAPSERERMIVAYHYLCKRGARKFLRPDVERGDLEQVAAIALIKACDRYDGSLPTPFEAYAWISIVGEIMNHLRAHKRASHHTLPAPTPCRAGSIAERIAFQRAIASLSQTERSIIRGIYAHGFAQTLIAAQLSISVRHVARLHRRALDVLRYHLAN